MQHFQVDLTNCDKEPIHIPGKVQPHGFLVSISSANLLITYISQNAGHFIGINAKDLLGKHINELSVAINATAPAEPPGEDATPPDLALLLNAALETTRADVNAATLAQEAGEDRRVGLGRTGVHLNAQHLDELKARIEGLLLAAQDHPDDDGVWTTVLWTAIDREDRRAAESRPRAPPRSTASMPPSEVRRSEPRG